MPVHSINDKKISDLTLSEFLSTINKNIPDELISDKAKKKRDKERAKMAGRHSRRVTYDLPPVVRQRLKQIASDHAVPESQVVTLALARFISDYEQDKVDLGVYKEPSTSPRYEWNLVFPSSLVPNQNSRNPKIKKV
jgi:hypothetical protein